MEPEEVVVLEEQPCKLSYEKVSQASQSGSTANVVQVTKIFLAPEVQIKEGSKITVTTKAGITKEYKQSAMGTQRLGSCQQRRPAKEEAWKRTNIYWKFTVVGTKFLNVLNPPCKNCLKLREINSSCSRVRLPRFPPWHIIAHTTMRPWAKLQRTESY